MLMCVTFVAFEMLRYHVQLRINAREIRRFTYETMGRMELLAVDGTPIAYCAYQGKTTHSPIDYQQLVKSSLTKL